MTSIYHVAETGGLHANQLALVHPGPKCLCFANLPILTEITFNKHLQRNYKGLIAY